MEVLLNLAIKKLGNNVLLDNYNPRYPQNLGNWYCELHHPESKAKTLARLHELFN